MSENTGAILRLLEEAGTYLSGDLIGRECSISRSAVWKHIRLLRGLGYAIDSCRKRGYLLRGAANTPLPWEVSAALATETFGRDLDYRETVDSTNRVAAERAAAGAPEGATVVAETQLAGRGRRGRVWVSPPGVNLYFSIVLRPRIAPARIGQIPLVAAVALHRALSALAPAASLLIKWPNDILAKGGGKLAGILCEAGIEADVVHHAVVGIGINVNGRTFPPSLAGVATSLAKQSGAQHSRPRLLAAVLNNFEQDYRRWLGDSDLGGFLPYLQEHSALRGRTVAVEGLSGRLVGRVEGISPEGELLLRDAGGLTMKICSGDVRIAPLAPAATGKRRG
jgi:BirA family transcriptional regulator, biotin operon repressor / biotin---[acetyl-CoA-carboxylase] ligase